MRSFFIFLWIVIAQTKPCVAMPLQTDNICEILPHHVDSDKYIIDKSLYFYANIGGHQKHFRLTKGWSSDFSLSVRVQETSQAQAISSEIERAGFEISRYNPSQTLSEALPLPPAEGPLDLFIPIKTEKTAAEIIKSLGGRLVDPTDLKPRSLDSVEDMRTWVYWNFSSWRINLSKTERDILFSFRTSGYKHIQLPLRDGKGVIPNLLKEKVSIIDHAIQRGTLDRNITIFHASADPFLEEVWNRGVEAAPIRLPIDDAYTFTSMSKKFTSWWRDSQHHGKGVILEIEAKKGSHMVPMERLTAGMMPDWLPDVSELELLLPRKSQFVAYRTSLDPDGNKIMHCKLLL